MVRRALVLVPILATACSAPPAAAPAVPVPPAPAATARAAPPPPPVATARAEAPPEKDDGPPPDPPISVRWTMQLPSVDGQPGKTERLVVNDRGDAAWESVKGVGDGDVDEELSPAEPTTAPRPTRCKGHVGPVRHRRIVLAALRAMASGCAKAAAVDRLGRPVDEATTTVAVKSAGKLERCELGRSGGSYVALEAVRAEVVGVICAGR
jgi:hypothetical protein